ncbi:MAG: hypothetical protein M1833_007192 [Piccolia ochrophora]|nr:MAG: hypothetical protein M1833_007192 [Piccolia ochrophora]
MSGKLDQSLDEILSTRRRSARRPGRGRGAAATKVTTAPTGGIQKNSRAAKPTGKAAVPTAPARAGGSKIIMSNLPSDVDEAQIKDYLTQSVKVGVKKCMLTYGPNGISRGVATVIFREQDAASKAAHALNGTLIDKKPLKVEVVLETSQVPAPAPPRKLNDRIVQAKNQPKSATAAPKATTNGATTATRGGTRGRARGRGRGRNAGRAKPKTADELDAEMADYFDATATNGAATTAANGAAPAAAATADAGMEDEIL